MKGYFILLRTAFRGDETNTVAKCNYLETPVDSTEMGSSSQQTQTLVPSFYPIYSKNRPFENTFFNCSLCVITCFTFFRWIIGIKVNLTSY